MSIRYVLIIGCSLVITLASDTVAYAQLCPPGYMFSWTLDNDSKTWVTWPFGPNPPGYPGSDDGYTSGSKWTFARRRKNPVFPFHFPLPPSANRCFQHLWKGGWEMYTPANHSLTVPDLDSRPYAGFWVGSYVGGALDYGFGLNPNSLKQTQTVEIELGLVGPATRMKQLQWWIHDRGGHPNAHPTWAFQINNEFGGYGAYHFSRKIFEAPFYDVSVSGGGSLGDFLTEVGGGATFRLEMWGDMSDDVLPGDKLFSEPPSPWMGGSPVQNFLKQLLVPREVYIYTKTTIRFVKYDITLDGNYWGDTTNTHTVKKETWVGEYVGPAAAQNLLPGLVLRWRIWKLAPRLTFDFVRRSPPYRVQSLAGHRYDEHLTVGPPDLANKWEYFGSWEFSLF
jgi:lipid A 3-O-deacylase